MKPLASVLLPVHDAANTLEVCLRSIVRQTEPQFEVLVVDDGSTDDTVAIARAFASGDPRFRVIERSHEGLVPTLNAGIEHARGDIIVRMDGDDIMHRERLALQIDALSDATLSAVGCHVRLFPRDDMGSGLRAYEAWLNGLVTPTDVLRDAFIECPIAHPTLAIRTGILAEHGYRDRGWPEDYDLVLRLLGAGRAIAVVPKRLLMWRNHPTRLSRMDGAYAIDRFTACRAHHLARSFVGTEHYVLWGFGHTGKALRRALAAEGKSVVAIVDVHPGRIGQVIHGAPVIQPEDLPEHRGLPILVSVAGARARTEIRSAMREMDLVERRDYVCCA
jgi:glycosyltransferase involved in cell wall biosynthesis